MVCSPLIAPSTHALMQVSDVILDQQFFVTGKHLDRMAAGGEWEKRPGAAATAAGSSGEKRPGAAAAVAAGTGGRAPGFVPWHFEQNLHEAVFVPAGCPHQVGGKGGEEGGGGGRRGWGMPAKLPPQHVSDDNGP